MKHSGRVLVPCALALGLAAGLAQAEAPAKSYRATQDITVDRATGKLRRPNAQEVTELVQDLVYLTRQPSASVETVILPGGVEAASLDSGFAGVMLARPNADGSWEMRCVFTFEEGAAFLGLVADDSQQ